jgi:non-lysosomal glucosylceramidase
MPKHEPLPRRTFLKQAAGALGAASQMGAWPAFGEAVEDESSMRPVAAAKDAAFPRIFAGRKLKMIAFPLGGVAAGSVALGGRGQLRDWEVFNRPNKNEASKGYSPAYAFPSIWARAGDARPVARVLEARILPPYEGQDGLGANNAPGLIRQHSPAPIRWRTSRLKIERCPSQWSSKLSLRLFHTSRMIPDCRSRFCATG